MSVEPAEFRRILSHWCSGVAIVSTITPAGAPRGLTASAVAAVSLHPPLVLACVERGADSHEVLVSAGFFAISILAHEDERIARRFAGDDAPDKFRDIAWHGEVTRAPVLDSALAWLDCRVHAIHDGGDHSIFVGAVVAGDARDGEPLLYFRAGFHRLPA